MRPIGAYYGHKPAQGIYLGSDLVWEPAPDPTIRPPWVYIDAWGVGYGSGQATATGPTGSPVSEGTILIAVVATRPNDRDTPQTISVADDIGSPWTLAGRASEAGSSTMAAIYVNTDAEGLSAVQATIPDSGSTHLHVIELAGPTGPGIAVTGKGAVRPDGTTWAPVEVDAPAGAMVIGAASLGVTSRTLAVAAPFALIGEEKRSQVHSLVAGDDGRGGLTGPQWVLEAGTSSSLVAVTAAFYLT